MIPRIIGIAAIGVLVLYFLKSRSRPQRKRMLANRMLPNRMLPRSLPMPASPTIH